MHPEHVFRDHSILLLVRIVGDDKEQVETRKQGVWKSNVLVRVLVDIVLQQSVRGVHCSHPVPGHSLVTHLAVNRVGSGKYRASRVERCMDTGLGDRDGLLLHDFVDGHSVDIRHLVKLVDTHHTTIGEHHSTCFEPSFSCHTHQCLAYRLAVRTSMLTGILVCRHGSRETDT